MSTQFICSQCRMILNRSERRSHISADHLDYFPYGCPFCKKANKKHLETTKDDMDVHIATYHNGNNLGILLLEDKAKEVELNRMIEQCQDFKQLNGAGTSAGSGNTAQNASCSAQVKNEISSDDDIIIIEDDSETTGMPNNPLHDNLPEQPIQEHIERMATMEPDEPQEHPASHPITNSENNDVPNRVMTKSEPSVNTSDAQMETNEPTTEQAVTCPITENSPNCENTQTLQDIALEIVRPELDQNHSQNHNAPAIAETCVIIMTTDQASDNGDARLSKQNEVHIAVDSNVSGDITATATSMPIPTETPPLKRAIMPNMQIRSKAAMPPIALQKPIRDEEIPLKLRLRFRKRIRYGIFEGHTETKRGRFSREDNSLATSIDDGQNQQQLGFDESSSKSATDDNEDSEYRLESESDGETLTSKTRSHDSKNKNCGKSHKAKDQRNSVQTRTHAREKPFKCKNCNYAATKRYILNRHERIHSGEKPYKCQSCIYATVESCDLTKHNRIHTGEKPFKCQFCQFATAVSGNLINHVRIHSGEKPFKCRICKFATAQSCNLIQHVRIHSGEKPFKCRFCQFASNRSDNLNSHMNTQHKEFLKISAINSQKNT